MREAGIFWVTGTGLSVEPSRSTTLEALTWRDGETDRRPRLAADVLDRGAAASYMRAAVERATVAVGNREEAGVAVGEGEPLEMARRLLELGPRLAIVKLGPRGVLAATADEHWVVPPAQVEVVNGLGAGDAFGGALCHGLLVRLGRRADRPLRQRGGRGRRLAARLRRRHADAADVEALL